MSPNVVLVMADQLAPHFTGTYGHPIVQTPNLDALAERGVRFDATYCHSPLCAPSRFTMLSGQPVSAIGAWDNAAEFGASVPTFAHHLGLLGYRTILAGKMHFVGPDQLHGFDERLTTDIYPADFGWTPNWERADERIDRWYHGMDSLHDAGVALATYQLDYDEEVGHAAIRKLWDLAREPGHSPFLLCASFTHPHDPYVARPEWWDRYADDDIDLPDVPPLEQLDLHTLRIRHGIEADTVGHTDEQARTARHAYFANTTYFDHWLGRIVEVLDQTGRRDDTVVIATSDHGDMLGDRGVWFKMSFFERSARVPLVMAGPGIQAGHTVANASSLLDVLPTLVDIATDGGHRPELGAEPAGRSLWHAACGGADDVDEAFGEYTGEMTSHPIFMIRRGRFKYIHCDTDPPLLHDLEADPLERHDLADDPGHRDLAAGFATEVAQRWCSAEIRERVLASQRARRAVHASMTRASSASRVSWDHLPRHDVANAYLRNHMDWEETGRRTRYPPRNPGMS